MLRLLEILLFLTPFVAFGLWRLAAPAGAPSPRAVVATAAMLLLLAGALLWFSRQDVLPPNAVYAPAQFHDGHVVPGRGVPP